ncbi:MAG TPA: right-handed parallel beta-helix repeat-containing protein [Pedococcus sp.]|uniref:right-handed parallel beta-helix repeat-containing protein n=1 Tax=Pedococcus sp. TaxID=2860345 RepID=UPI002F92D757
MTPSGPGRARLLRAAAAGLLLVAAGACTAVTSASTATPTPTAADAAATTTSVVQVATTGSDATGDGSAARPYRTVQRAVDRAPEGSRVVVAAGTYPGFAVTRDGLTVAAAAGAKVLIRGTGHDIVAFDGVVGGGLERLDIAGSAQRYGSAVKVDGSRGVRVVDSSVHDGLTFGITVVRSSGVLLQGNDVFGHAAGIEERFASDLVIRGNRIHHNLKRVDSGRGFEGINFYKSTGTVTVEGNRLWDNLTHFEVYGASNLVIRDNVTSNGQVMETGTTSRLPCAHNVFVRNVAFRGTRPSSGMILRCASDNLIAHNTFDGFDTFALDVVDGTKGVAYGGSVERLRILNNVITGGRAFSIDSTLPDSVVIDFNLVHNVGSTARYGRYLAYVAGHGNTQSLAEMASWTGQQRHGLFADPRYVSRGTRDYRLSQGSPAIDRGMRGLEPYLGAAPDLGRYETR